MPIKAKNPITIDVLFRMSIDLSTDRFSSSTIKNLTNIADKPENIQYVPFTVSDIQI